ncbi:hypothetical protein ACCO45_010445 [Purpureocillium lilacinum]|uniref:Uncharacterized protein n=1 Tax=Purpureocillium lilacinum TaxID=33203 RepID=A0ACC4DFH6_PURLI
MVAVNDFAAYYAVQLPFGGVAGSGYSRFAGEEGLRGMCNLKSVCEDRFGWLGQRSWNFTQGVVELGYGGPARKAKGLARLLKNM